MPVTCTPRRSWRMAACSSPAGPAAVAPSAPSRKSTIRRPDGGRRPARCTAPDMRIPLLCCRTEWCSSRAGVATSTARRPSLRVSCGIRRPDSGRSPATSARRTRGTPRRRSVTAPSLSQAARSGGPRRLLRPSSTTPPQDRGRRWGTLQLRGRSTPRPCSTATAYSSPAAVPADVAAASPPRSCTIPPATPGGPCSR